MSTLPSESGADGTSIHDNPYAAPQVEFEPQEAGPTARRLWWFRLFAILQIITICIGVPGAFLIIESIIASGSIVSLLGLLTLVLARRWERNRGMMPAIMFGLSGPIISLFCFALIFFNDWGPGDARHPVSLIVLLYGSLAAPLGLFAVTRSPKAAAANAGGPQADSSRL